MAEGPSLTTTTVLSVSFGSNFLENIIIELGPDTYTILPQSIIFYAQLMTIKSFVMLLVKDVSSR